MTAERWRLIERLFAEAVELSPSALQPFLDRVCDGDDELRRELESLLECDAPNEPLVDIPTGFDGALADDAASERDIAGQRIGSYRLIRLIGHGGMGAVYLGVRDDEQYQKQVAIKVLKRGMDTDFMLSHFRQERQILANLEHPFIARMLDGGATGDGLPYFVMEYVDGIPITKYCAEKGLSVPERLRLFRLVCEAVQYAHQNLVVHRDIKPSNILVAKEGTPKLLDFDFIEEKHAEGEPFEQAVLDAGIMRLRPVMITVGATVFGLFPLAAHGGPLWEPLCYAQIGGLTAATFITLLLVPVFYAICVMDLKIVKWEQNERHEPEAPRLALATANAE